MPKPKPNTDYSKYTFEDFLLDDYFLFSVKDKKGDTITFWKKLKDDDKINWKEYCAAKNFLESLDNYNNSSVSNTELAALHNKIKRSNRTNRQRKLIYTAGCIAASIIILLLFIPYLPSMFHSSEHQDIMRYAQENDIRYDSEKVQILLSEDNVIRVEGEETDIIYDSTEIKIAQKGISKKELPPYNQLFVPKGKRSKLTLSDGTKLVVNAGTRVVYPIDFPKDKREIYVNGEIFIDVSHDKNRPFIVKTKDMDIHVVGTKFNVMAYESDQNKQIVLTNGIVKISGNNRSKDIVLEPTQMYECNNGAERVVKVDVNRYISWIDGVYIFESLNLSDVMKRLSHYYGVDIICDKDISGLKCSGKMDLKDDLDDVLKGLSFSFPIKIEHINDRYNIKRNQ